MRVVRLLAFITLGLAACGSSNSSSPDATAPDAKPIDAVPGPDACPLTYCPATANANFVAPGMCIDTTQDEQNCGGCGVQCTGGKWCDPSGAGGMGACACPAPFVPPANGLGFTTLQAAGANLEIGFGLYADPNDAMNDALIVGYDPANTPTGQDIQLSATPGTPPFIGAGFHVTINGTTPKADAAVYAMMGSINFDKICDGGFSGTATDLTFSGVNSLTNPTIDPNGCSFTVTSLAFAYGNACP